MAPYLFLLPSLALLGCGPATHDTPPVATSPPVVAAHAFGELHIWPTVDTTDAFHVEAIAALRRFCTKKVSPELDNDYWHTPDLERFGCIHPELLYAEFDSVGELRYPPTLLAIRDTGKPEERLMTVRWAAMDSAGVATHVRYVFDFLAVRTADGVRLAFPLDHHTRQWARKQVGGITYIVSPVHVFDEAEAHQQSAEVERLARFFEVPAFPITFYSCTDPTELFRIRGYQDHPLMHIHATGGRAEGDDLVFSGNDKDLYTHEIVHLFTARKFTDRPWVLDEGLATVLAGSSERPFVWHRANFKRYLTADPSLDLAEVCSSYEPHYIDRDTNVAYAIGGVLCERILRSHGKAALFAVMTSGADDLFTALADHGITRANLRDELLKELAQEPLQVDW